MTKRFEKYGDVTIKTITFLPRCLLGFIYAVAEKMPDTLRVPYEIRRRKEEKNGKSNGK